MRAIAAALCLQFCAAHGGGGHGVGYRAPQHWLVRLPLAPRAACNLTGDWRQTEHWDGTYRFVQPAGSDGAFAVAWYQGGAAVVRVQVALLPEGDAIAVRARVRLHLLVDGLAVLPQPLAVTKRLLQRGHAWSRHFSCTARKRSISRLICQQGGLQRKAPPQQNAPASHMQAGWGTGEAEGTQRPKRTSCDPGGLLLRERSSFPTSPPLPTTDAFARLPCCDAPACLQAKARPVWPLKSQSSLRTAPKPVKPRRDL